ncbi:MAG: hypothetical protein AAF492_24145, partial [Verrucomicrobiota bacterium]
MEPWVSGLIVPATFFLVDARSPTGTVVDTKKHDGVAHFLFDAPPQIQRYHMALQQWLSPICLSDVPTSLAVDDDGLYVAFGPRVSRFNLDGSGETHLFDTLFDVHEMIAASNFLFANYSLIEDGYYLTADKTTGAEIDRRRSFYAVVGSSYAPGLGRLCGRTTGGSPSDIGVRELDDTGMMSYFDDAPYHGDFPDADRTFVFADETRVTDTSGIVYDALDMTFLNYMGGPIDDMDSLINLSVIVRDDTLYGFSPAALETGSYRLSNTPSKIYIHDAVIHAFREGGPNGVEVEVVPLNLLTPDQPVAPVDPTGIDYIADHIEEGADGIYYVLSKTHRSIFRWSFDQRDYLSSIPLIGEPNYMTYSPELERIYLTYTSGKMTRIDVGAGSLAEEMFAYSLERPCGLAAAGDFLFVCDPYSWYRDSYMTWGADGFHVDWIENVLPS